jgi:hypothetical protein
MPDLATFQTYLTTITSVLAIAISSVTLGWTIYRDAIRRPKFKVDVGIKRIVQKGHPEEGPLLSIDALNMGPIPNRIGLTFARKSWFNRHLFDRATGMAMIYPDFGHWATTKSATRLEVGDQAMFVFPYKRETFLNENFVQVGVADGFGRIHWSKPRDFRKVRDRYKKDFGS